MSVHSIHSRHASHVGSQHAASTTSAQHRAEVDSVRSAASAVDAGRSDVLSPAIRDLLVRLRNVPEVREGHVQQVRERLLQGDYLTPEAARQTAARVLSSDETAG